MERTFAMIKPNGIQRNLIGEIIKRFEQKGLKICALKLINVSKKQALQHYDVHQDKPFFNDLVNFIISGPVVVMVIEGHQCVEIVRLLAGATDPKQALAGTIRGDFSSDVRLNIIHTADSIERAKYEISIYFDQKEITEYSKTLEKEIFT